MADEGHAPISQRLADLAQYRADLLLSAQGQTASLRWQQVFVPLQQVLREYELPIGLLLDLLDAFEQDVHKTAAAAGYADRTELLDYCRRSANPIGRLLLHLYKIDDAKALAQSDSICTALQLINFWQDLSVDIPRGRYYLPQADCASAGVCWDGSGCYSSDAALNELLAQLCSWTQAIMRSGQSLALQVPGRAGWELRLVVQGGLCVLERVRQLGAQALHTRPKLHTWDAPALLWHALRMGRSVP